MAFRDHQSIIIDNFNGLYDRGSVDEVPLDHFTDCNNLKYIGDSEFATRDGIIPYLIDNSKAKNNILRAYPYDIAFVTGYLVLVAGGDIYHHRTNGTVNGPILSIATMTDFGCIVYAGRAYITPILSSTTDGITFEVPVPGESLYVYGPTGVARTAGVTPPAGAITPANGAAGHTDSGLHIFGVVFETDTGALSQPAALASFTTDPVFSVSFTTIPTGATRVTKRHIVVSKVIVGFNGDLTGYDLFYLPNGTINDNVTTVLNNISFYDADLIDDATHLFDNYATIPAGVNLCIYHNRLCLSTSGGFNLILVSAVGEPESFSQIDGFLTMAPNDEPITNVVEFRDILYGFKRNKTAAWVDNGDVPSSWSLTEIDNAIGTGIHGIALTTQSTDYLIIASYTGLLLFNGRYIIPELSWKIANRWSNQTFKTDFRKIFVTVDYSSFKIYLILTDGSIIFGDFSNGLNPKKIRWSPWAFNASVVSLGLVKVNTISIVLGGSLYAGIYWLIPGQTNDVYFDWSFGPPPSSGSFKIPDPTFKTAYVGDSKLEGESHIVGIRLRITGSGVMNFVLKDLNDIRSSTLTAIFMTSTNRFEPTILANFQSQRIRLIGSTSNINEIFLIRRLLLFVKSVAVEYPM